MSNPGCAEKLRNLRDSVKDTVGYRRIVSLFDNGSFQEIDPLAESGGGPAEAVAGYGTVDGRPACAFSQNGDVAGGAMSKAQASKIRKTYRLALKIGCPVVGIYDSIGGRLDEQADMLAACGDILLDANNLSGVVPQISLVLGPCTGTQAMIAAGADIVVMSEKGELTVSTSGADGSPEEAEQEGVCQIAAGSENEAVGAVRRLLSMLPSNNLAAAPIFQTDPAAGKGKEESGLRGTAVSVCDGGDFLELGAGFGTASFTGLARLGGTVTGIVGLSGVLDADSCSKAARFVRFCDSFSIEQAPAAASLPAATPSPRLPWAPGRASPASASPGAGCACLPPSGGRGAFRRRR